MPRVRPSLVPLVFILGLGPHFYLVHQYYFQQPDTGWVRAVLTLVPCFLPLAIAYYLLGDPPTNPKSDSDSIEGSTDTHPPTEDRPTHLTPLPSLLFPAYTSHARLLPTSSRHAFSYPLVYLAVDIDALCAGELDLPGRVFTHGGRPGSKVLGLRSRNYLRQGEGSFREKLENLLAEENGGVEPQGGSAPGYGLEKGGDGGQSGGKEGEISAAAARAGIGRVWLVTMPSFMGFEGINPLSVWYVYNEQEELATVVLEVHNTFGEKHAYVLHTSSPLAHDPKEGYTHAWTFPRSFHVSPFNSRDGFYTLDILDPFPSRPQPASPSASASADHSPPTRDSPEIRVFLRLLTPSRSTKLTALLASHPSHPPIPLRPGNTLRVLGAVCAWPLSLLLTTLRILLEAWKLHYRKRLAVYPRPEPITADKPGNKVALAGAEQEEGGEEGEIREEWNAPQRDVGGVGRAVGRQAVGCGEKAARGVISRWLTMRLEGSGASTRVNGVIVRFKDEREELVITPLSSVVTRASAAVSKSSIPEKQAANEDVLVITTSDPKFFTNLLIAPSAAHFCILAPEQLTTISDQDLFQWVFDSGPPVAHGGLHRDVAWAGWVSRAGTAVRRWYITHLFTHSRFAPPPHLLQLPELHWSDSFPRSSTSTATSRSRTRISLWDRIMALYIITMFYLTEVLEERAMRWAGAQFVDGREPWRVWERAWARHVAAEQRRRLVNTRTKADSPALSMPVSGKGSEQGDGSGDDEWVDLGSIRYS